MSLPPVLDASEWADAPKPVAVTPQEQDVFRVTIAMANEALDAEDPHKFTWGHVDLLREAAIEARGDMVRGRRINQVADILESYLSPRGEGDRRNHS